MDGALEVSFFLSILLLFYFLTSALSRVSPSLLCFIRDKITEDQTNVNDEERKLPDLDEWDNTFCDALDDDAKVDMILAANLLDIKPLLDIVCISVASLVKGQSPEELRKVLERTAKPIPEVTLSSLSFLFTPLGLAFSTGADRPPPLFPFY